MKRSSVVGIVVASVLVLGVGSAVAVTVLNADNTETVGPTTSATSTAPADDTTETTDTATETPDTANTETPATSPGAYIDYTEQALASAEGTRVLYFHAPWCPNCRALEADIKSSGVPEGVTILKVDYDSNQELRQKYGVTLQTTLVSLDAAGNKVALFTAYDEPTLKAALAGLGLG